MSNQEPFDPFNPASHAAPLSDSAAPPSPGQAQNEEPAAPQGLRAHLIALAEHRLLPFVLLAVVLAGIGIFALSKSGVRLPGISPAIVVFDPVKFMNAQRAAASIMAVTPSADLALTLTQVAKQAEPVIQYEARGAVVLIRQAVVAPDGIPDITDAVLARFGLPTNVPTVSTGGGNLVLESVAPTDSAFSKGKLREDYLVELDQRTEAIKQENENKSKQEKALP